MSKKVENLSENLKYLVLNIRAYSWPLTRYTIRRNIRYTVYRKLWFGFNVDYEHNVGTNETYSS